MDIYIICCLVAKSCLALCHPMECSPPSSSVHGDSPDKNTTASCHALLQGIFPTQGQNSGLPFCRWILYHLSYQGIPTPGSSVHINSLFYLKIHGVILLWIQIGNQTSKWDIFSLILVQDSHYANGSQGVLQERIVLTVHL